MSNYRQLEEFERNFEKLGVGELRGWKKYWLQHAEHLAPKVRKRALKRVHKIDKAIQQKLSEDDGA
jgi:hypothetical protein